ncbi:BTB/POZ domain-containing protein [Rhizophagus irregularis DAOM 181602=DAOM 197198]|nr:BTB/POZ domain-containing protein [Rhizophagus irregularis DAOM 181602=DAOM 197198]
MSLIKVFKKLNKTNTKYDVIIHVGKEPNFKEFHADSKTLRKKSDYFDEILSIKDIEKKDEKHLIKKPNITPQIFDVIIKYLSKGKINLNNKTGNEILNIIIVSVDLKLNELIQIGENFLIKNHQKFLQYDSVEILQRVHHLNTFNKIQKFCLDMICFKPYILFNSDEFIHLPSSLLEIILKQDDLNLDEIEIWEILIKWGLSQDNNNILYDDISEWNRETFNNLERNLRKFIPLIGFYDISTDDYFTKIKPFEQILPKELREDILKFHTVPEYEPTFDTYTPRFGGYNPLDWNRFGWKNTSDSFIFSFGDYKNINTGKIGRINNNKFRGAVISDPEWGPIFGKYKKGRCDLSMDQNGDWSSYPNTYSNVNIPKNYFDIDDYEVFQVEKVNMFDLYVEDVDYKKE